MTARDLSVILIFTIGVFPSVTVLGQNGADSSDYYGEISVTAEGVKAVTSAHVPLKGDVYINGRFVGETPYVDGLPRGKYEVRVASGDASKRYPVDVKPGEQYEIKAELPVALTDAEQREMARAQAEAAARQRQEQIAYHQEAYDLWKNENDAVHIKRKPLLLTSALLMGAGTGVTIAGFVFLGKYKQQEDNYSSAQRLFSRATAPEDIEYYRDYMDDTQKSMKRNKAFAAVFVPVGIASLIGSFVCMGLAPKKPQKPNIPSDIEGFLNVGAAPFISPHGGGLSVVGMF